jgi:hypothetical protein
VQTPEVHEAISAMLQARLRELKLHKKHCEMEVKQSVQLQEQQRADEHRGVRERFFSGSLRCSGSFSCMELTDEQKIGKLLEECHDALLAGRQSEAEMLAKHALSINARRVAAHPLVYKLQLLTQVLKAAEPQQRARALFSVPPDCVGWEGDNGSVAEFVDLLLTRSHELLLKGKHTEAEMLLRQAEFLSPTDVAAHPLVYKMQLMDQVLEGVVPLQPHMPPVDPTVVRAYNEILEMTPDRFFVETQETTPPDSGVRPAAVKEEKPAVLEVEEEACELELVNEQSQGGPSVCFEKDANRLRLQVQFGPWTFKLVDEGPGKQSFTFSLSVLGSPTEKPRE